MWVRKIGKKGNSEMIVLPTSALKALSWERGDHLILYLHNQEALIVRRFDPLKRPDLIHLIKSAEVATDKKLPVIKV